jgi:DNA-binding transcriptional LysR family regulator
MTTRQLRYFLAVAEHRHFTRAAEASFVSQPALSQQIQALEKELGTPLFDRLARGVELTVAGTVLSGYAEQILREMENARLAVEETTGRVRGELSLSAVHTASVALVVEALASFRKAHPEVSVRMHEESSGRVVESVLSGHVNLGVTYLPVGHSILDEIPIFEEELMLVVPQGHPLVASGLTPDALSKLPLIVPPEGFCLREGIDLALEPAVTHPTIMAELSSVESICAAVQAELGATLLPASYLNRKGGVPGLVGLSLPSGTPRRLVGAVRRTDRHLCLATQVFLSCLTVRGEPESAK